MKCCKCNIPSEPKCTTNEELEILVLKVYRYAKQLAQLIENFEIDVDDELSETSENPVKNKVITEVIKSIFNRLDEVENVDSLVIDEILTADGINPVQGKAIYNALLELKTNFENKIKELVIDDALSETSDNAVKNKVIALAIKELKEDISNLGVISGIKIITVYRIYNTKPEKPVGGEYDFNTGIFTAPTDWFISVNPEEGDIVWGCLGIVYSNSNTIEWQDPFCTNGSEGGSAGSGGLVTARVPIIYKSSITKPSTPVGGVYNFESDTFTAPNGWKKDKSGFTDDDVVWMSIGSATSDDVNIKWSEPIRISGGSGSSILKRAKILTIYTSSVENPGTPSGGNYDFTTEQFEAPTNWQTEDNFPEGSVVWMSIGSVYQGDENIDWSKPIRISGGAGSSIIRRGKVLSIYKASPITPLTPSGGSYDFDTNILTVPEGWTEDSSSFEDGEIVWLSIGNVIQGDNIINWSKPLRITPGVGSANITIAFVAAIYINSETKPDTPTGGSYNFETKELTPPNGWSKDALSGDNAWFSVRVFYKNGTETAWSEPKPAASADVTLTTANLEVIAQKVKLTSNELDIIAGRVNLDAQQLNIISQNVQLTTDNLITIANNIDVSAINLDVLAQKITLTTQELNTIAANVNLQANQLDIIASKVQLDAEDLQIISENVVLTTDQLRFIADNINLETIDYSVLARNITLTSSELSIVASNVKFTHNELLTIANNVTLHTEELSAIAERVHFSADDLAVVADKVSLSSAQLDVIAKNITLTTSNLDTIAKKVTLRTEDLNTIAGKVTLSSDQLKIISDKVVITDKKIETILLNSNGLKSSITQTVKDEISKIDLTADIINIISSDVTFYNKNKTDGIRIKDGSIFNIDGNGIATNTWGFYDDGSAYIGGNKLILSDNNNLNLGGWIIDEDKIRGTGSNGVTVTLAKAGDIYAIDDNIPSTPSGGNYDFDSDFFIAPNGWSKNKYFSNINDGYVSIGAYIANGSSVWSEPFRPGTPNGYCYIYGTSSSTPSGGSFNTNSGFTAPNGWSTSSSSISSPSVTGYISIGVATSKSSTVTWSKPIAINGKDKSELIKTQTIYKYKRCFILGSDGSASFSRGKILFSANGEVHVEGVIQADGGYIGNFNISNGNLITNKATNITFNNKDGNSFIIDGINKDGAWLKITANNKSSVSIENTGAKTALYVGSYNQTGLAIKSLGSCELIGGTIRLGGDDRNLAFIMPGNVVASGFCFGRRVIISSNYTVTGYEDIIHVSGSSSITITLPTNCIVGKTIMIVSPSANVTVISASSSYPIYKKDGTTTSFNIGKTPGFFVWTGLYWVDYHDTW